jgi:uncharacterized membrane protein
MLSKIRRLALFVLAMVVMVALVLASALLLRDPQLRPIFLAIVGLIALVTGIFGVALSMRRGLLVETGLGIMATTFGAIFILAARPWLITGI